VNLIPLPPSRTVIGNTRNNNFTAHATSHPNLYHHPAMFSSYSSQMFCRRLTYPNQPLPHLAFKTVVKWI
jgi:hypothetical protein